MHKYENHFIYEVLKIVGLSLIVLVCQNCMSLAMTSPHASNVLMMSIRLFELCPLCVCVGGGIYGVCE